ncbi:hypothetical protein CFP56_033661 [Quercus suber]|uniref:Uncharacterized protein n=1 Tax=Quercus suber TaxID=58331 RepID=A0AAW0JE14_QUESU
MCWNEHKDINEVYNVIYSLFNGHADLLDEFRRFLLEAAYLSAEDFGRSTSSKLRSTIRYGSVCSLLLFSGKFLVHSYLIRTSKIFPSQFRTGFASSHGFASP